MRSIHAILGTKLRRATIFGVFAVAAPCTVSGQPSIDQARWQDEPGQTLQIRGQDFGTSGPDVRLFDTFNNDDFGDPAVGSWFHEGEGLRTPNTQDDIRIDGDHSLVGGGSAVAVDTRTDYQRSFQYAEPGDSPNDSATFQEIYFSYSVKDVATFPGAAGTADSFSDGSTTKDAWLMLGLRGDSGGGNEEPWSGNDFVIPGWAAAFLIHSNSNAIGNWRWQGELRDHWAFQDWNQIFFHADVDPTAPVDPNAGDSAASGFFGFVNDNEFDINRDVGPFMVNPNTEPVWDRIKFAPWYRLDGDQPVKRILDQIYVATGAHAKARVMLGDADELSEVTQLHHLVPTDWSSDEIVADASALNLETSNQDWFIYVFSADNASNQTGYPVALGCGNQCPKPPQVDTVQVNDGK